MPPAAGYPPQGGYGQPPMGFANQDEKTYVMIAHWGGVAGLFIGGGFLGWIGPMISYMAKGTVSPTVRAHSVSSLNFHITWAIVYTLSWVVAAATCFIGSPIIFIAWIVPVIFGIIGAVKATSGEFYRYPMSFQFVK
jgi:uncharacterized Tic20 family protein